MIWFIVGLVTGIVGTFIWSSLFLAKEEKEAIDALYERMKK